MGTRMDLFFHLKNRKRKHTGFILLVILFSMHVHFHKNQNVKPLIDVVMKKIRLKRKKN